MDVCDLGYKSVCSYEIMSAIDLQDRKALIKSHSASFINTVGTAASVLYIEHGKLLNCCQQILNNYFGIRRVFSSFSDH